MGLIIADKEFIIGALRIKDISSEVREIVTSYMMIINDLLNEGICDISVRNLLAEKADTLDTYINITAGITDNIVKYTESFITDIDEADACLYDLLN